MTDAEVKPLQPLNGGLVVIVGGKASNFDEEIRNHPRVVWWDSQNEQWQGKDLPANTRAVFFTKWVGHSSWNTIMRDARKRDITVFNNEGTGMIMRQVRELLDISKIHPQVEREETKPVQETTPPTHAASKLHILIPFIDYSKNNVVNAHILMNKANEFGIRTTLGSLSVFVGKLRRKQGISAISRTGVPRVYKKSHVSKPQEVDASVQILDNMIQELRDMRQFLIATTDENARLRARLDKFRKMFED